MASKKIRITNGPSKFDIMLALFDGLQERQLVFQTDQGAVIATVYQVGNLGMDKWTLLGEAWTEGYKIDCLPRRRNTFRAMFSTSSPRNGDMEIA